MEQEKHGLRRKLDSLEGDYESRISELQCDLNKAKKELSIQQSLIKQIEQEKTKIVQELVEQNHRLTNQLKQVCLFICLFVYLFEFYYNFHIFEFINKFVFHNALINNNLIIIKS